MQNYNRGLGGRIFMRSREAAKDKGGNQDGLRRTVDFASSASSIFCDSGQEWLQHSKIIIFEPSPFFEHNMVSYIRGPAMLGSFRTAFLDLSMLRP
jgi:hypothetical protein